MIAIIDTHLRRTCTPDRVDKASRESGATGDKRSEPVDKVSRESAADNVQSEADRESGMGPITWSQRPADAPNTRPTPPPSRAGRPTQAPPVLQPGRAASRAISGESSR